MHPSRTVSQSDLGRERVWPRTLTITPRRRGTKKKLRSSVFGEFCVLFGTSPAASLTHIRRRPCDCNTHESPQRRVARDALLRLDVAIHEPTSSPTNARPPSPECHDGESACASPAAATQVNSSGVIL